MELIILNYTNSWREFGKNLNLTMNELAECKNIENVLSIFLCKCVRISDHEITFKLGRAFGKSGKKTLRTEVFKSLCGNNCI